MKKILIINTGADATLLFDVLSELNPEQFTFSLLANYDNLILGKKYNWQKKRFIYLTNLKNPLLALIFLVILPLTYLYFFFYLLWLKWRANYSLLLCCNEAEKIIFSPLARILKLKVVWLTFPGEDFLPQSKIYTKLLLFASCNVNLIALTAFTKQQLSLAGYAKEAITVLPVGVNLNLYRHQENIFSKLAAADSHWPQRKFFTIGTALDLDRKQNIEVLFNAVKKILDIVSFPQVIIVGDGKERKNLAWIAKRIGIENYVWFVGEQQHLKKWLDSFDVFVVTADNLKLEDINIIIRALTAKLPLIGPNNVGLEGMVTSENGILIEPDDSEALAQSLIKLQQRKDWRWQLGEQSKKIADERFSLETTITALKNILS